MIFEGNFKSKKHWMININKLSLGINTVEITTSYKDGGTISEVLFLYNKTEDNLGSLDNKDDDNDKIENYK